jgi:glutamate dehydrogenase/leucine dehydrogenase
MEELMRCWDGEYVVMRYDHGADAWMFIAVHSTVLGNASGGTRMKVYETPAAGLRDAQRLAAGMTYKWAGVDFPQGGGKGVIALSRPVEGGERERLLERYGELVESQRGGFSTGADLGVGPELVRVIARETSHVFGLRGAGDPGPWTALGVFSAMQAVAEELFGSVDLEGHTVLVQGMGDVGVPLGKRLVDAGADLKIADINVERAAGIAGELGAKVVDADKVYSEPCDIFAPCAVGGVLSAETISRLCCKAVAGSANNQLETSEDAERLHERGILYAPDFISNAGGAVALCGMEALGMTDDYIMRKVLSIRDTLTAIFKEAKERGESPLRAAERRVQAVLERGPA